MLSSNSSWSICFADPYGSLSFSSRQPSFRSSSESGCRNHVVHSTRFGVNTFQQATASPVAALALSLRSQGSRYASARKNKKEQPTLCETSIE